MITRQFLFLLALHSLFWCYWTVLGFSNGTVYLARPKPEPYFVEEGNDGPVLECSFSPEYLNRAKYEISWTAVIGGTPKLLTRNDINFAREEYELLQDDAQYSLHLKNISYQANNGRYYCTIMDKNNGQQEVAEATVVVLVAPKRPEISLEPKQYVTEGDLIKMDADLVAEIHHQTLAGDLKTILKYPATGFKPNQH